MRLLKLMPFFQNMENRQDPENDPENVPKTCQDDFFGIISDLGRLQIPSIQHKTFGVRN